MPTAGEVHSHSKKSSSKETEYLEGWKRARAEVANMRKKLDEDKQNQRQVITRSVIENILPLADNFRALVQHVPENFSDDPWTQGVTHVARQFEQVLADYGVEVINPVSNEDTFNPDLHEAIAEEENKNENETGIITEVAQVGYKLGDYIIRPAKVKVKS